MARKLLADSDFFIALYKKDDSNHQRAMKLLETLSGDAVELLMSVFIYSEIATVLSQRVGKQTARYFMNDVEKQGVQIVQSDATLFERARHVFQVQTSKNVSFADATNIALAQIKGIEEIASFDADYAKNGLMLAGRS